MSKTALSPERLAELLKRYPHEPNLKLAAEFGITRHQVGNYAYNHGVKKTAATTSQINGSATGIANAVLGLAQAAGSHGISRHQATTAFPHFRANSICNALHLATTRGQLHRAGRQRSYRWFTELKHALAHNKRQEATAVPVVQTPGLRGPAHCGGAPVVTAATRLTPCPGFGSRAPAAAPADGLFSNLGPGHYIDAEAKPWINAATSKGQHA